MQRIEIPKGSKVTIEDGVILIEPAEKWEPKVGEIVKIRVREYTIIAFYTNKRGNDVTTGINCDDELVINGIGIHDNGYFTFYQPSQKDKTRLLTALADAGYRYNKETHEVEKGKWKPKLKEKYWTFTATCVVEDTNNDCKIDKKRVKNGFAFQTEQEAQEFFDKIKQIANGNR